MAKTIPDIIHDERVVRTKFTKKAQNIFDEWDEARANDLGNDYLGEMYSEMYKAQQAAKAEAEAENMSEEQLVELFDKIGEGFELIPKHLRSESEAPVPSRWDVFDKVSAYHAHLNCMVEGTITEKYYDYSTNLWIYSIDPSEDGFQMFEADYCAQPMADLL